MKRIGKLLLSLLILAGSGLTMWWITQNPPEAEQAEAPEQQKLRIETMQVQQKPYTITVESYGTVSPRTQSGLVSQTEGQITLISDTFNDGGFFKKGDLLVEVDDRDYKADIKVAKAALILAKQSLLEETARARQAGEDWKRLGKRGKPNALALRIPQLETAKANVLSAEAQVERAKLALDRTRITAPFSGRFLKTHVDIGQVVSKNTLLADLYSADYVEVRLPIRNRDLALMELPVQQADPEHSRDAIPVRLISDLIGHQEWKGRLVRTEGTLDSASKQLYVVAQIDNPFQGLNKTLRPIKIGQYVTAKIRGRTIDNATVIPIETIYEGRYVYVEQQNIIKRRNVQILWQDSEVALISKGLSQGDNIVLTHLGQVNSGTRVIVVNTENSSRIAQSGEEK